MDTSEDDIRPSHEQVSTRSEFARWYWPVDSLHAFCDRLAIAKTGRKQELRERVGLALDGVITSPPKTTTAPVENWGRKKLSLETVITEGITFGPNVRAFFKDEIGKQFVCNSDFMDWVRENTGATLADAVMAWRLLERRKEDPAFRREIASCNNFLQYLRDIRDANETLTLEQAKRCWDAKKVRPARDGYVCYAASDLRFLAKDE